MQTLQREITSPKTMNLRHELTELNLIKIISTTDDTKMTEQDFYAMIDTAKKHIKKLLIL